MTVVVVSAAVLLAPAISPTAASAEVLTTTPRGAALGGVATGPLTPADWPGYRNREGSGGFSRGEQVLTPATVGGLRRTASSRVANFQGGQAGATGHGLLYRSGAAEGLAAYDLTSGALVWSVAEGSNEVSVGPTAVYTLVPAFGVAAYRVDTGALLWRHAIPGLYNAAPPTLAGGRLLLSLRRKFGSIWISEVVSLSTATGIQQWRNPVGPGGSELSHVAVRGSLAVLQVSSQNVVALDLATGVRRWTVRSAASGGSPYTPTPVIRENAVYVGLADGVFRALDPVTGRTLWTRDLDGSVFTTAAEGDGVVYAATSLEGTGGPDLWALDATTGAVRWSARSGSDISSPTLANGVLYIGAYHGDSALKAYDAATGALLGTWPIDDPLSEPMVSGGKVRIVTWRPSALPGDVIAPGMLNEFTL